MRITVSKADEYMNLYVTVYEGDSDIMLVLQNQGEQSIPPVHFKTNKNISAANAEESTYKSKVNFEPQSIVSIDKRISNV